MSKNVGQLNVKLTADTKPLEQGVDEAVDKLQEAQGEVEKTDSSSLDNLKNTIESVFGAIKNIGAQLKAEWDAARAPIDSVNNDMQDVYSTAQMMKLPIDEFAGQLDELDKEQLTGLFDEVTREINEAKISTIGLKQELAGLDKTKANSSDINELRSAINQTSIDTQTLRAKLAMIKQQLESIKDDNIRNIGTGLKVIGASAAATGNKLSSSFKKGLKSLKRFTLGLLGIRTGINYLVQAMKSYISSSDTMSAKTAGISQALAQSLAPYAEIAVNALQKLVHWVIVAVAYFTTFINKIFGTNIAIAGMAGSMKSLTKNTKKAAKAAKDALAPFDEFHILQEDSSSDTGANYVAPDFSGLGISEDEFSGLTAFGDWLDKHKETIKWLLITITAIVAIWVVWNAVMTIFNALAAANPIVLIILAAIAAIALIIIYWDDLKEIVMNVLNAIGETITWLWENIIKPIIDGFVALIQWVIEFVGGIITAAIDIVVGIFQGMYDSIKTIIEFIVDIFKVCFNLIVDLVKLVITTIINYWKMVYNTIKTIIEGVWNVIKTIFNGIKDFISKILKGDIAGAFESLKNTIINVFNIVWSTIKKIFSNIWDFIKGIAEGIADTFSNAIKGTVNAIIGFAENVINGLIKAINLAIGVINAIPGVDIKKIALLDIPRLKDGTVATGPMVAEIGEYSGAKTNPEIVSPEDRIYANMVKALRETQGDRTQTNDIEITLNVKYEDGKTIIKKINAAQNEAGETLLEV